MECWHQKNIPLMPFVTSFTLYYTFWHIMTYWKTDWWKRVVHYPCPTSALEVMDVNSCGAHPLEAVTALLGTCGGISIYPGVATSYPLYPLSYVPRVYELDNEQKIPRSENYWYNLQKFWQCRISVLGNQRFQGYRFSFKCWSISTEVRKVWAYFSPRIRHYTFLSVCSSVSWIYSEEINVFPFMNRIPWKREWNYAFKIARWKTARNRKVACIH